MGTTQPIKDKTELRHFKEYYKTVHPQPRNYALIVLGLHTALRISDILQLKWEDVYDFKRKSFRKHLNIHEKKTRKENQIALNARAAEALWDYMQTRPPKPDEYIFTKSTDYSTPICRSQAYRIVKAAADASVQAPNISCHSLRKTFGYHAWKQGTPPALLMDIFNHSSYNTTKKYLGISQDERDTVFKKINF